MLINAVIRIETESGSWVFARCGEVSRGEAEAIRAKCQDDHFRDPSRKPGPFRMVVEED